MKEQKGVSEAVIKYINRLIIKTAIGGSFLVVWYLYYGKYAFQRFYFQGGLISLVIFMVIYNVLGKMYKGFKIQTYQIGETVLSQLISFGVADLVMYVICILASNRVVSIIPGVVTVVVQSVICAVWALVSKRYYMKNIRPKKTLLIYSFEDRSEFRQKLEKKCSHLFDIREEIETTEPIKKIYSKINEYETIMLYSVEGSIRTDLMEYCIRMGKILYLTPRIADIIIEGCEKRHLIDTPMLKYEYNYNSITKKMLKRILDFAISATVLLLTSPIMLLTAILIKLEDGGSIFFRQERCTRDGAVFSIYKFRSMVEDAEKHGARPCMAGDDRITRVGRIIRKIRVDELPQLLNVLKGDMSFVGPRPERIEHVQQYAEELPEFNYRLRVKGGLTGYAQIYGKYNTSPYDKLRLDMMYIENQSLLLDFKLIMLTIKTVFIPESTEGFEKEKSRVIAEANRRYGKFAGEGAVEKA